ncbi:MAG TPA: carboxypeptidase regulatory-like domain-containing protein [Terriglobales bacterium]|jgi:hypothetical protein|nr:carboxypeptidase regulatory-like domain-containing protein [Terriglobales bacterium]
MKSMKFAVLALLALSLCLPVGLFAQEVASLTGVVSDKTGAVLPGATLKLLDTRTNTSYEATTNSLGSYVFVKLPPGPGYKLTVTKDGFDSVTIADLYLGVQSTRTQNVQLEVGAVSQSVEVSAVGQGVTLDTTDATIGNNFDMRSVHDLPIQVRDSPAALLRLQPGVVDAAVSDDPNSSRDGAVTGARSDQGNITLDGLDVNDFATGQAFSTVGNAPVDSIQEFRGETANPLAASGRGSGAQINLTTKSGTNTWHGSAYEYHRNTITEANTFFNNRDGLPRTKLIRNQFGADLGGPILKDKLFFFFDYQGRRDAREDSVLTIVPLDGFRNGDVSYINNSAGCTNQSRINTQPNCITTLSAADLATIDPQHVGPDAALLSFINSRYPRANDLTVGDGVNTGGFRFNSPVGRTANDYVTRIDYNLSSKMKLFGRFSILRDTGGDDVNFSAPIQFPGDPLSHTIVDTSYSYVIGHTWTISNNKINQFVFGETRSQLNFPTLFNPVGSTFYQNFGPLTGPFSQQQSQHRIVPVPIFRDDFTYVRGTHTIQVGATFKPILSQTNQVNDFNFVTLGLGGRINNLNASLRPADILDDPVTQNLWDSSFTFDLGRFGNIGSNFNNGVNLQPLPQGSGATRDYRYYETEVYLQDTWRMRTDLTMTYGLRYQYYSVPYEVHGFEAVPNLGFANVFDARVPLGAQGIPGPQPITTYDLAGKANHGPGFYHPDWRDFAPRLSFAYNPSKSDGFLGRLLGDRKTVIRAGAGVVFDHPVTNALNFIQNQASYLFQNASATPFGTTGDPAGSLLNDPRFTALNELPQLTPPTPITRPFAPFVDENGPFGTATGQANYAIDPNLKTPYSLVYSFGIQRELPGNFVFEANYFARLGRRLLAQSDAGQIVNFKDPASGQLLANAFASLSRQVRANPSAPVTAQPFFENQIPAAIGVDCNTAFGESCSQFIVDNLGVLVSRGDMGDVVQALSAGLLNPGVGLAPQFATDAYITNKSFSSYNGLLLTLHKKLSHNLQFDFNYTYAHSIDNVSSPANNVFGAGAAFSGGLICDVTDLSVCRGNSDFDVTHNITVNGIYDLPFGHGKRFGGNVSGWLNQIIGGWQIAGIQTWRTGFAFTTTANAFPISFAGNVPAVFNGNTAALRTDVHTDPATGALQLFADPTAARGAFSGPLGLQAGSRNNLRGPRFSNLDLAFSKHFPIRERLALEFRAEAYNLFNHPNFGLPGVLNSSVGTADITNPSQFGVITTTASDPREWQFALRFDF